MDIMIAFVSFFALVASWLVLPHAPVRRAATDAPVEMPAGVVRAA